MTRKFLGLCCVILAFIAPAQSLAAAEDLFRVAVPVASQNSSERAKAAALGLRQVLIRMAGSPEVVDSDVVRQAYSAAQSYIEQFHYEPYAPPPGEMTEPEAAEVLVMTFSRQVIERLLREANQPYWPPNRPSVFVWLVQDLVDGRVLINNRESEAIAGLVAGARDRGLRIRLPLLDLEDQLTLPAEQVWRLDEEAILRASERYDADTLLIGRYSQTSRGEWLSTWQFLHRGADREYDLRADSAYQLGRRAIGPLANYLARLYAISPHDQEQPQLVINLSGIEDFGQYRQALDYLQGLAMVADVNVKAVRGDTLLLYLQVDSDMGAFRNILDLDRKVQPAADTSANPAPPWLQSSHGTPEQPLNYVWAVR